MDAWDFADPVDILSNLPKNFNELIGSKKWQERKEALDALQTLATDNIRLDPQSNYQEIIKTLSKILAKDANINVAAAAAKCVTQLAKGLRTKFGPFAVSLAPVICEKFKEKKATLRDPLIEAIDAVYATTNLDALCHDIAAAIGKPNPNVKIQTNLFLYRVFKAFNVQTAPKNAIKTLTPVIVKCTGESDAEVREAAFAALGAIMKAIGKTSVMPMLGDVASDKTKMTQIHKFFDQAIEESQKEAAAQQKATSNHANGTGEDVSMLQSLNAKLIAENTELKTKLQKSSVESNEMKSKLQKSSTESNELKTKLDKSLADNKNTSQQLAKALQRITELENENKKKNQRIIELEKDNKNKNASLQNENDPKKRAPMLPAPKIDPGFVVQKAIASGSRLPVFPR